MNNTLLGIDHSAALQQPPWDDVAHVDRVRARLASSPALVDIDDVIELRAVLATVSGGRSLVIQAGDCAEDPAECSRRDVARKVGLLDLLADALETTTKLPVIRAGRIAGQFTKPRSDTHELVGASNLPVYRGHMVNSPEPLAERRRPDPQRILTGYRTSRDVLEYLGWGRGVRRELSCPPVWSGHEALLLDYEVPMLRRDDLGRLWLASTHWPWIGDRTRHVDGPHVALLAEVVNPVACKVGPTTTVEDLLALCERLDPMHEPGRLTLIARMGAGRIGELLPPLVDAVGAAGHPVVWLSDPMHANTVRTPAGYKTRYLQSVLSEVRQFRTIVENAGGVAGGLHLETTPDAVTECVRDNAESSRVGERYTSLCDPRLNPSQALEVMSAWPA